MNFDVGSTCKMYKGKYLLNGKLCDVACKQFSGKIVGKHRQRFDKELRCTLKLCHPNVFEHIGMDLNHSILVTEYLEHTVQGPDGNTEVVNIARQLLDVLEEDLPWSDMLSIIKQACKGLDYLHDNNVLHMDLKSANIFLGGQVGSDYIAKIGDLISINILCHKSAASHLHNLLPSKDKSEWGLLLLLRQS